MKKRNRSAAEIRRVRLWNRWFYAAAVLLAVVAYGWRVPAGRRDMPGAVINEFDLIVASSGVFCSRPAALEPVLVKDIIDGDTLRVLWNGTEQSLRYYGVDTPEMGEPCYGESVRRNRRLAGSTVWLGFDRRRTDPHGRLLAYVFDRDGRSIEAQLIAEGLGRAWRRDGRFRGVMGGREEEARMAQQGCLWSGMPEKEKPG